MPSSKQPIDVFKLYNMNVHEDACWQWHGAWGGRERELRPYFMSKGKRTMAYRWVYELIHGIQLTHDQQILHSCDNGGYPIGCGNPAHLRVGTREDNTNDAMERARHGLPKHVVRNIRKLLSEGRTQEEIAKLYGMSRSGVSAIAIGRIHGHVQDEPDT